MSSQAEQNLLVGFLALSLNFISREQFLAGMNAWVGEKSRPLADILAEQGALAGDVRPLLDALVAKHLSMHGNEPRNSLAALSSVADVRERVAELGDDDVNRSLAIVGRDQATPPDHAATQTFVGQSTSQGQRFRILRPHAEGGLGKVYVARDEELNREVALKEIKPHYAASADQRGRFLREAEITGGLEHPGIVPVYGVGQYADGRPFYAMRFIKGDSLKEAIERFHNGAVNPYLDPARQLELRKLLQRFIDVCEAIDYAHSRGVLHRDLKPGNVMLGKYGETLVVDWGLAKAIAYPADESPTPPSLEQESPLQPRKHDSSAPTEMGAAVGTPAFMPPEQAAGRLDLLGPASDVYSLGATLYALLTGQPPVKGENTADVLETVRKGQIAPPRQVNRAIPRPLEAICRKALSLERSDRYASAGALARDVENWLADEPVAALREPLALRAGRLLRRHRTLAASIVAGLLMGIAGLAAIVVFAQGANQRLNAANAKLENSNQKLASANDKLAVTNKQVASANRRLKSALASESKAMAAASDSLYTARMNLAHQAWERAEIDKVRELLLGQIPKPGEPDRRTFEWFYYWEQLHSELATLDGFPGPVRAVSYSHDGRYLAIAAENIAASRGAIYLWEVGSARPPRTFEMLDQRPFAIAFQPQGDWLAYCADAPGMLRLKNVRTGETRSLAGHAHPVRALAFSRDGKRLATTSLEHKPTYFGYPEDVRGLSYTGVYGRAGEVLTWDMDSGAIASGAGAADLQNQEVVSLSFSRDGTRLLGGTTTGRVHLWDIGAGKRLDTLQVDSWPVQTVAASPDDDVALLGVGGSFSEGKTYRASFDGDKLRIADSLDHSASGVLHCSFSPSGQFAAAAGFDRVVRVWDQWAIGTYDTGYTTSRGHAQAVQSIAFSPLSDVMATGSWDGTVKLWSMARPPGWVVVQDFLTSYQVSILFPNPTQAFDYRSDGFEVFDRRSLARVEKFSANLVWTDRNGASYFGRVSDDRRTLSIWPFAEADGQPLFVLPRHPEDYSVVSPNGKWLLTHRVEQADPKAPQTLVMKCLDVASRKIVGEYKTVLSGARGNNFIATTFRILPRISPDETRVAASTWHGELCLWSLPELAPLASRFEPTGHYTAIDFSPDGRLLATGHDDGMAELWDPRDLSKVFTFPTDSPISLFSVRFSPDGRLLVVAGRDQQIKLLDVAARQERMTLRGPANDFYEAQLTPDGRSLFARGSRQLYAFLGSAPSADELAAAAAKSEQPRYLPGRFELSPLRLAQWRLMMASRAAAYSDWSDVLAQTDAASAELPNEAELYALRGLALANLERSDEALADLARAQELGDFASAALLLRQARARGDRALFRSAVAKALPLLEAAPDATSLAELVTSIALDPEAVPDWAPIVAIAGKNLAASKSVEALRAAALAQLRNGEFAEAEKHLSEALALRPISFSARAARLILRYRNAAAPPFEEFRAYVAEWEQARRRENAGLTWQDRAMIQSLVEEAAGLYLQPPAPETEAPRADGR
jgi:serine/threonine protein kinase/WD40 repeat protein